MVKSPPTSPRFFLFATAFAAGFVVMALEILGFRIFAPHFGYSIYVSGTLIGIVMVALSSGYYLGGRLADTKGDYHTIFLWIFLADIYLFLMLVLYTPILTFFSDFLLWGVVLSSLVLFAFPMTALSMVSPYLTKLLAQQHTIGKTAGSVSSISTIGSILGTFIPTFLLIPYLGSFKTFFISAGILLAVLFLYLILMQKTRWSFLALIKWSFLGLIIFSTFFFPPAASAEGTVLETESVYNLIKVVQVGSQYQLRLNDDKNMQSLYIADNPLYAGTYHYYLSLGPLLNQAKKVLVLGMGAGTSPLQMIHLFGTKVDAVEIDPKVVAVAQEYFGLTQVKENLQIFIDDARPFVKKSRKSYDLIQIDMYQGGFYAPFYVLTQEFFAEVKEKLTPKGIVAVNVLYPTSSPEKGLLVQSMGNTLLRVFPRVYVVELKPFNALLFAVNEDISLEELRKRVSASAFQDVPQATDFLEALHEFSPDLEAEVFTDDKAPVERLTFRMLDEM